MWLTYLAAARPVFYGWVLTGRDRLLDSGALWFAAVLLVFSLAYAAWRPTGSGGSRVPLTGSTSYGRQPSSRR